MEKRLDENQQVPREVIEYQLGLLKNGLAQRPYPGYPEHSDRLVADINLLQTSYDGRLVLPDGPWNVDEHPNRSDAEVQPTEDTQEQLLHQGLQLDAKGRPLHPWLSDMIGDPDIGVVTGKGAYLRWGPNRTVDPIVIKNDYVLLVKRKDTGNWAFPGGFIDKNETSSSAAIREVLEETGIVLSVSDVETTVYEGLVADIRVTANAWPETIALLFSIDDDQQLTEPKGADDAAEAAWIPLEAVLLEDKLFGSHQYLLQKVIEIIT